MSGDYIKREYATSIPVIPKEHRKHFNSLDDAFETGWNEALACVFMIPCEDVVEASKILKTADEQEKQGFIQTAKVLRELVSND